MVIRELLESRKDAIVFRWMEDALSVYGDESSALYRRQTDPFANPVGKSLREGTRGIFEALIGDMEKDEIRRCLREILKIRAVQNLSASQALGFLFALKDTVRLELADRLAAPEVRQDLSILDRRIDHVALAAFDVFTECREQVYQMRVNEIKRNVSWIMSKLNQRACGTARDRENALEEVPT